MSITDHIAKIQALIDAHSDTELCDAATASLEAIKGEVERLSKQLRIEEEIHDQQMAAILDGTFSVGDGTAQQEIERLLAEVAQLRPELEEQKNLVANLERLLRGY